MYGIDFNVFGDNYYGEFPETNDSDILEHYGTPRHSGRYPWGSGDNPYQHDSNFYRECKKLKEQFGYDDKQLAEHFNMKLSEFKDRYSVSRSEEWSAQARMAIQLKDHGYANGEIARRINDVYGTSFGESQIRNFLNPAMQDRAMKIHNTAEALKAELERNGGYLDVGAGVDGELGVSEDRLKKALYSLQEQGYEVYSDIRMRQVNNPKQTTILRILAPAGTTKNDIYHNMDQIRPFTEYSPDGGKTFEATVFPRSMSSERVMIRYAGEEGGELKDGVIELRPDVADLSLGKERYSQVRIAVDGTHYLKGMAMYGKPEDFPPGVDVIFNTNKDSSVPKMDVLKKLKVDKTTGEIDQILPFGSMIKRQGQSYYEDPNGDILRINPDTGKEETYSLSVINKVNGEGDWNDWSRTLSSQFLSKQPVPLIKRQLDLTYDEKLDQLETIKAISNDTVRKQKLLEFAEDCDASAVHLKATGFPRQRSQVILPLSDISDTEIYAPNFKTGEQVALVRYPHQGIFEIPKLTVNNELPSGKSIIGNAKDAVGINPKTAVILSGADFDGDTVTVIPLSKSVDINSKKPLTGLNGFAEKMNDLYALPEGGKVISKKYKNQQMGVVSNLITDMTIKGAPDEHIERAVKHAMVVIDSEKHKLDYRASYKENGIAELKEIYQKDPEGHMGASTIVSRSKSQERVDERKDWFPKVSTEKNPTGIDPETGEKVYAKTGGHYINNKGVDVKHQEISTRMAEAKDARKLSSGYEVEEVYANYANRLKSLANETRKLYLNTPEQKKNASAVKTYAKEVESLNAKLAIAEKNAPKERMAQIIANTIYKSKVQDNPEIAAVKEDDKKVRARALEEARKRVGAGKERFEITEREWQAIQAGAVGSTDLKRIMNNAKKGEVEKYAMPNDSRKLPESVISRIKARSNMGYPASEIAESLGVSVDTVLRTIDEE